MQKKRNTKSVLNFTDIVLCTVCICGMGFALNTLWTDMNQVMARQDEKPIAIIYFKRNTAQRRFVDRNLWERLQTSSELYDGDRVRTAAMSEVAIVFKDSSRIDIHENTLIQIHAQDDATSINFESGSLGVHTGASAGSVKVVTGSQEITLTAATQASIKKSEADANSGVVAVLDGAAVIKKIAPPSASKQESGINSFIPDFLKQLRTDDEPASADPAQVVTVGAGKIQAFTDNTSTGKEPATVEPAVFMPASVQTVSYEQGGKNVATWMWNSDAPTRLEFSREPRFSTIIAACDMGNSGGKKNIALTFAKENDKIFWRMKNLSSSSIISNGVLYIEKKPELPTAIASTAFGESAAKAIGEALLDNQAITTSLVTPDIVPAAPTPAPLEIVPQKKPEINEKQEKPVPKVVVKKAVAKTPIKKTPPPVKKKETPPAVVKEKVPPIIEKEPKIQSPKVTPASVSVSKVQLPDPKLIPPVFTPKLPGQTPVLQTPANGMMITEAELANISIEFSWKPVEGASSYELIIYRGSIAVHSVKLLQAKLRTNKYVLKESHINVLDNGVFTWSVCALGVENGEQQKSKEAVSEFTINLQKLDPIEIDTTLLIK